MKLKTLIDYMDRDYFLNVISESTDVVFVTMKPSDIATEVLNRKIKTFGILDNEFYILLEG